MTAEWLSGIPAAVAFNLRRRSPQAVRVKKKGPAKGGRPMRALVQRDGLSLGVEGERKRRIDPN